MYFGKFSIPYPWGTYHVPYPLRTCSFPYLWGTITVPYPMETKTIPYPLGTCIGTQLRGSSPPQTTEKIHFRSEAASTNYRLPVCQ